MTKRVELSCDEDQKRERTLMAKLDRTVPGSKGNAEAKNRLDGFYANVRKREWLKRHTRETNLVHPRRL